MRCHEGEACFDDEVKEPGIRAAAYAFTEMGQRYVMRGLSVLFRASETRPKGQITLLEKGFGTTNQGLQRE